ncbi:exosome complex component CSL4 isoform X5 [Ochotona curzoniae]|uniref:exosome complex component CSL4 isoform X5 n=1 Tax=Ochotona curzoniae TaxID=130825 RepID=UPI001B34BD50|nr:exosome complex component CSL4 isoform X5 [Ochotona curzoniae]
MAPPVRYCIPGERLCNLEEGTPGSGTYTRHGYIFSSLAGCLTKTSENGALPVVSVMRETESQLLPDVGAIVTCKVSSINSRFAKVQILYVGSTPLKNSFRGTIRKEDIRATEKDKVVGVQMVPISWCEMQCPRTHTKEFRKVARVQPEFLQT